MKTAFLLIGLATLLAVSGVEYAGVRNRLVEQQRAIDAQWTEVEGAMQRRADQIYNLAGPSTVFSTRSALVEEISNARSVLAASRTPQEKIAAYIRLNSAISRLLAAAEQDPHLRTIARRSHLRDEVSNTETDFNNERRKYNEALETYNKRLQLFPNNIVAATSGFTRNDAYIQTAPGTEASKVQF